MQNQKIIPNNLEWQSAPSKSLVLHFPERSRNKNDEQNTNSVSIIEEIFRDKISGCIYPDFRYYCHYCGKFDVFLKASPSKGTIEVCCLECKKVLTVNVGNGTTKCLC